MASAVVVLARFAVLLGVASWAEAQAFPDRPIVVQVGFAAGGPVDNVARTLAAFMARDLGQPVVIENRPGAAGLIAAAAVARAKPDGHTLILQASPTQTVAPFLNANVAFDPLKDYSPISGAVETAFALVIHKDHAARDLRELVAYARANPGKLTFASSGAGSSSHLAAEMLRKMTGTEIVHVPYKGTAPALTDVVAGQVAILFMGVGDVAPFVRSGRVRALGISTKARSAALPDVPTIDEAGVPGFDVNNWFGLEGPPGLAAPVVARLNGSVRRALADPAIARQLVEQQSYRLIPSTPDEMSRRIQAEYATWSAVIRSLNLRPE